MTIEELRGELEKLVSILTASGCEKTDAGILEKLDKFVAAAGELGMKEGKHLIENLAGAIKAIQEGKSKADSGVIRLTALDFYVKKLAGGENTEDL
jgi:ABC-type arginine transport system permease subunit